MFGYGKEELICRSHSGELQWFHAMGSTVGEPPSETKQNIVRWMDTMYNVAAGALDANTRIWDTWLGSFYDNSSKYNTIGELLHQRRQSGANIQNQELGSCFHVI